MKVVKRFLSNFMALGMVTVVAACAIGLVCAAAFGMTLGIVKLFGLRPDRDTAFWLFAGCQVFCVVLTGAICVSLGEDER